MPGWKQNAAKRLRTGQHAASSNAGEGSIHLGDSHVFDLLYEGNRWGLVSAAFMHSIIVAVVADLDAALVKKMYCLQNVQP